ncbi:MAG: signal peptidase II [Schaedlerella sp.]|nr:signal peptidase II [Schaedlerella sp.]
MGILLLICITIILALADIVLKSCVENSLTTKEERYAFKEKIILRKVYNKGFCLNLLEDKPEVVKYTSAYMTVLVTIYQLFTLMRKKECLVKKTGLSFFSAGAWSNTFDRWIRGYVIDYVGIPSKDKEKEKFSFNLADVLIALGGILVVCSAVFEVIKEVFQKKL